jgi:hypothetical protein
MGDGDWLLLRRTAATLLAEARTAWPTLTERERAALARPLKTLADTLAFLDKRTADGERLARPGVPMVKRGLLSDCRAATVAVRRACRHDGGTAGLWQTGAALAYALATVEEPL